MAIQSKTKDGTAVTLSGYERYGVACVRVNFVHPAAGPVEFDEARWGEAKGPTGAVPGVVGVWKRKNVCVTVPRADFDAAMAEARAIGEREVEAIKSGAVKISVRYHDGEYLSGYSVGGREAGLLVALGLAKPVDGWGYLMDAKAVEALGEEFTYEQAAAYARPAIEAKKVDREVAAAKRQERFDESRVTGRPVELRRWSEPCCERDFDCSQDIVTEYAQPDGTTRTERIHTH